MSLRYLRNREKLSLVTLATPFVEIVSSAPSGSAASARTAVAGATGTLLLLLVLFIAYGVFEIRPSDAVTAWAPLALLSAVQSLPWLYGLRPSETNVSGTGWLSARRTPEDLRKASCGGASIDGPVPLLVLRGVDDEAGLALAAGAIGNVMISVFLNLSLKILAVLTYAFLAAVAAGLAGRWLPALAFVHEPVRAALTHPLFLNTTAACFLIFVLFPILAGVCKFVYGRELLLGGYVMEVKSATAPDATAGLRTLTLPPQAQSGLRHGLYSHEGVVEPIAEFAHTQVKRAVDKKTA